MKLILCMGALASMACSGPWSPSVTEARADANYSISLVESSVYRIIDHEMKVVCYYRAPDLVHVTSISCVNMKE